MKLTLAIFLLVGLAIAIPEIEARNLNNEVENGIKNPTKLIKALQKFKFHFGEIDSDEDQAEYDEDQEDFDEDQEDYDELDEIIEELLELLELDESIEDLIELLILDGLEIEGLIDWFLCYLTDCEDFNEDFVRKM